MERITLHEEYRLIERTVTEVNGAWKGAHLLLFFMAFVFGSFCTFCFHLLMYLFDEKCVLFPKLMSITSLRQNIIYDLMPGNADKDALPVDFLSTQWVEKSACLLPTYVPLVSGIFGLVWTTMFLMFSSGSRILTGLQRPWRILPPVFVFSLAMGCLCVYTSAVTHYGLKELCLKLSEITGSESCTYTINVATLAYERRIRGVYQATRLTIFSAWLHTACWLLSALLALVRVILAVDFKLVRITVQLQGNIEKMLERHERHIRTVSPDALDIDSYQPTNRPHPRPINFSDSVRIHYKKKEFPANSESNSDVNTGNQTRVEDEDKGEILYFSDVSFAKSERSLLPSERSKLDQMKAMSEIPSDYRFILRMLYNLLDTVDYESLTITSSESLIQLKPISESIVLMDREYGSPKINTRKVPGPSREKTVDNQIEGQEIVKEINKYIQDQLNTYYSDRKMVEFNSSLNIHPDLKQTLGDGLTRELFEAQEEPEPSTSKGSKVRKLKSNLKRFGVQTTDTPEEKPRLTFKTDVLSSIDSEESRQVKKEDKETQTKKPKQE